MFTRLKFAAFVPTAFYAAAFGVVLRVAVPSLSDVWNKVNFIGGNAAMGMAFAGGKVSPSSYSSFSGGCAMESFHTAEASEETPPDGSLAGSP